MSLLIDELSRIIASPIPRRKALRLAGNMLGGGILAYFGLGRASRALARDPRQCDRDEVTCGRICCRPAETCCGEIETCLPPRFARYVNCCGRAICWKTSQQCCVDHCCGKMDSCCGARCCGPESMCCNGRCVPKRPSPTQPCVAT